MSKSVYVSFDERKNTWFLGLREWYFQGDRPDYTRLCEITEKAARDLVAHGLADDLFRAFEDHPCPLCDNKLYIDHAGYCLDPCPTCNPYAQKKTEADVWRCT